MTRQLGPYAIVQMRDAQASAGTSIDTQSAHLRGLFFHPVLNCSSVVLGMEKNASDWLAFCCVCILQRFPCLVFVTGVDYL